MLLQGLVRQNAVRAARVMSHMAVALHEALRTGSEPSGLALVGIRVLTQFFPSGRCAHAVAERLIVRSMADVAHARWSPRMRPQAFKGIWQPAYPMFAVMPREAGAILQLLRNAFEGRRPA